MTLAGNVSYYKTMGVTKNASDHEIKRAYRKLALKYHPDQAKDLPLDEAEERFKEINEAYSVLSDPVKRRNYDRFGKRWMNFSTQSSGFHYTTYNSHRSRRKIIEDKLSEQKDFNIRTFADDLGVSQSNLVKILKVMIEKSLTTGEISGGQFIFI